MCFNILSYLYCRATVPNFAFGRHFRGAICSPLPARPCATVPGSKIFTEIPRRRLPPATPVGAAPPAKPYITVGPRQQGAQNPARRPTMLAPPLRQSHIPPSVHANRAPKIPLGGRPCWRCPAGKALIHRRATPTGRPKSRPAVDPVGAAPPSKPYITVGSRQQGAPNPARRSTMLAPPRRQSLNPPSGHANRAPRIPPGGRPCWRRPSGKALYLPSGHANRAPQIQPGGRPCWRRPSGKTIYHRRATPTGRPGYEGREKDCRYLSILKSMG